jgi:hypothetical protein
LTFELKCGRITSYLKYSLERFDMDDTVVIKVYPGSSYPTSVSGPDWAVGLMGKTLKTAITMLNKMGYTQEGDVKVERIRKLNYNVYTFTKA